MTSLLLVAALVADDRADEVFREQFVGYDACLIVQRQSRKATWAFNDERTVKRFSPCSTFKIPHSVFALHYGVVTPNEIFKWDKSPRPLKRWEGDHTLASAIEFSVFPVFQEIASRIGEKRMNDALKTLGYGDMDMTGGLNEFWLTSSLKISAKEQLSIIRSLVNLEWNFSKSAQKWVKAHLLVEERAGYRIFGKTGSGILGEDHQIGWWVGWVETGDEIWVFAGNYEGEDAMGHRMRPKVDEVLRAIGALPAA